MDGVVFDKDYYVFPIVYVATPWETRSIRFKVVLIPSSSQCELARIRGWDLHVCAPTVIAALSCVDVCIVEPSPITAVACYTSMYGETFVYYTVPIDSCSVIATVLVKIEGWLVSQTVFISICI